MVRDIYNDAEKRQPKPKPAKKIPWWKFWEKPEW